MSIFIYGGFILGCFGALCFFISEAVAEIEARDRKHREEFEKRHGKNVFR